MLPPGATLVPIIGRSDQTNLTNFSGDKKAWPVYPTIGNLPSAWRTTQGSMAGMLLALWPIPPKLSKSSKTNQRQRKINPDTLQDVFELIFCAPTRPATFRPPHSLCRRQGSTLLPIPLRIDRGPYVKYGTTMVKIQPLS